MHIYPDYYNDFKCIASRCKHNCCIGWEIEIDKSTLDLYQNTQGDMAKRLKQNISCEGSPHFMLDENERCPFLSSSNLCDIIQTLGEGALCDICKEHPRFHNELPLRVESGLGLCCEEAARIIIGNKNKFTLINADIKTDDEIIILRDKILTVLTDRTKSLHARLTDMMMLCDAKPIVLSTQSMCDILLDLEYMDKRWHTIISTLKSEHQNIDLHDFAQYMQNRKHEYEQLVTYIIYRHFANSPNMDECKKRAAFAFFAYRLIQLLGGVLYHLNGKFSFEDQVEIVRLFSSEIEYSDENIYALYDILT